MGWKFLSTPSVRRATSKTSYKFMFQGISIHALREEGDTAFATLPLPGQNFYPRPP